MEGEYNSASTNRFGMPNIGYGMGLRTVHYSHIIDNKPRDIDWFEIISENFIDAKGGRPRHILERVRESYPIVMHGVSMSLGSDEALNMEYLRKLRELMGWVKPVWVSDHLCWTSHAHVNTHDLLPVPYTEASLAHIVRRINEVQEFLGCRLLIENPSSYLEFKDSTMREWEFISRMAEATDCALLLDVNNVYVSCYNHRYDVREYLDSLPLDRVVQIHLAGHQNNGTHIVDTHDGHVLPEVWEMYRYVISRAGGEISSMVEWDDNIPAYDVVSAEVAKAREVASSASASVSGSDISLPDFAGDDRPLDGSVISRSYYSALNVMHEAIISSDIDAALPDSWIVGKSDFPADEQLLVYVMGYRYRLYNLLFDCFPALRHYLGEDRFAPLFRAYVNYRKSDSYNIDYYIDGLSDFISDIYDGDLLQRNIATDIARLEQVIHQLIDEEDSPFLVADDVSEMDAEHLLLCRIVPRAALRLMSFSCNVNRYYNEFQQCKNNAAMSSNVELSSFRERKEEVGDISAVSGSDILNPSWLAVYQHDGVIWRLPLEELEYRLLYNLFEEGRTVGDILEMPEFAAVSGDDIQRHFSRMMSNHLVSAISPAVEQAKPD